MPAPCPENETFGHRGPKNDPLYPCRKLLLMAERRLDPAGRAMLTGLLRASDPRGEVAEAWHAKEAVRFFYDLPNPEITNRCLVELAADLQDTDVPARGPPSAAR